MLFCNRVGNIPCGMLTQPRRLESALKNVELQSANVT